MGEISSRSSNPNLYFVLTFSYSWLFWIPAALTGQGLPSSMVTVLFYLGGLGPTAAGILLTSLTQTPEGRLNYFKRAIDVRRIGGQWYGVILLTIPTLTLLAAGLERLFGGVGADLSYLKSFCTQPLSILPFA